MGGKSDSRWGNVAMEQLAAVLPHSETRAFRRLDRFGIDQKAPREVALAVSAFFLKEQAEGASSTLKRASGALSAVVMSSPCRRGVRRLDYFIMSLTIMSLRIMSLRIMSLR
jgi:hypothetical protein